MLVGQMVEEVTHTANISRIISDDVGESTSTISTYLVRCEELSHLELLLCLGILVVVGEARLLEVMQSSDTSMAVVYTLLQGSYPYRVDGKEENLLVDLCTLALRYLLWYDGIHGCND